MQGIYRVLTWSGNQRQSTGKEKNTNTKQDRQTPTHSHLVPSILSPKETPRIPRDSPALSQSTALLPEKEYFAPQNRISDEKPYCPRGWRESISYIISVLQEGENPQRARRLRSLGVVDLCLPPDNSQSPFTYGISLEPHNSPEKGTYRPCLMTEKTEAERQKVPLPKPSVQP